MAYDNKGEMRVNEYFRADYQAYVKEKWNVMGYIRILTSSTLRILFYGRMQQVSSNQLMKKLFLVLLKRYSNKSGIEIHDFSKIGKGLQLSHPYGITVNSGAVIGENCTLFKGSTIGSIRGGSKAGAPRIGDRVVIGLNSTVVGNVKIGNDVFIASNSFVNFDVPDHSIVIGNPEVIKNSYKPTKMYV